MSMFFFIYTIAILCVCLSTASISLSAFVVSHRIKYLPQTTFFIAYFIELASIFAGEWAVQNIGQINYIVNRMKREMNVPNIKVIATGGLARMIAKESSTIDKVDHFLTLTGLQAVDAPVQGSHLGGDIHVLDGGSFRLGLGFRCGFPCWSPP